MACIWIFSGVCKSAFFARFSLSDSRCKSDAITSTKLEQTGKIFLGQPRLFECMGICVLSPAHESEMRGYLVYVLIVKYLSNRFCLNSAAVYMIGRPYRGIFFGIFFKHF